MKETTVVNNKQTEWAFLLKFLQQPNSRFDNKNFNEKIYILLNITTIRIELLFDSRKFCTAINCF